MKNWNKICGVLLLFSGLPVKMQAQKAFAKINTNFTQENFLSKKTYSLPLPRITGQQEKFFTINFLQPVDALAGVKPGLPLDIRNNYLPVLGFMCVQEIKLQKLTRLPLFIRLGSLEQCNYLEGKQ
jgi:hypothetical protein